MSYEDILELVGGQVMVVNLAINATMHMTLD